MGTPNWWRCFAYSTPSSSAAPARPTSAPAMSTRHSSTACSWSATAAGTAARRRCARPSRSERSAIGRVAEVVRREPSVGRFGLDHHELVVVEPDDDRRDGAGGHEAGEPVARRVQRERWRRRGARRRADRGSSRTGCAARREQATGHQPVDERDGREGGAEPLGDELEVEQRGSAATAVRRVDAHRRAAERAERVPQLAVESAASPRTPARPRADTPWRRTRGTTRRAVPARRSARGPPTVSGVLGVNVAGMRCHPPTIAQSGYSTTSSSAIS